MNSYLLLGVFLIGVATCAELLTLPQNCINDFNMCIFKVHNKLRSLHFSPDLIVDSELQKKAIAYSQKMGVDDIFAHSTGLAALKMGENLAMSFNSQGYDMKSCGGLGKYFAEKWYEEIKNYNFNTHSSNGGVIGHFTQLVWRSSSKIGCGLAITKDKKAYITCNYSPNGNIRGRYNTNVFPNVTKYDKGEYNCEDTTDSFF
ncbi:unnamed protein product [Brachionus calyciflorus]|uniref:SCP domain-containing protein n=1 Tax=Brachionus calyciflorus TaxID=104777 RepID=A0A814IEQ6_9BILA|nr:unnamed protein product [Brachionus calyciflorus]